MSDRHLRAKRELGKVRYDALDYKAGSPIERVNVGLLADVGASRVHLRDGFQLGLVRPLNVLQGGRSVAAKVVVHKGANGVVAGLTHSCDVAVLLVSDLQRVLDVLLALVGQGLLGAVVRSVCGSSRGEHAKASHEAEGKTVVGVEEHAVVWSRMRTVRG